MKELKAEHARPLDHYFPTTSGRPLPTLSLPREPIRPIIKELCTNNLGAFSGFGRHLANDFLHLVSIFPGMPSRFICETNEAFEPFATGVEGYLKSFTEPKFLKKVSSIPNSDNLFAFNDTSNTNYMQSYIHVFRRKAALVTRKAYIKYCEEGLLDPDHTIGK